MNLFVLYYYCILLQRSPTVTLKLKKSDPDRKVKWGEGTVDNEHMNKKKSKCMFLEMSDWKLIFTLRMLNLF